MKWVPKKVLSFNLLNGVPSGYEIGLVQYDQGGAGLRCSGQHLLHSLLSPTNIHQEHSDVSLRVVLGGTTNPLCLDHIFLRQAYHYSTAIDGGICDSCTMIDA